ncbi:MAG: hypothetical protein ACP5OH_08035 [Nitrososphaerota archaeon]
MLYVKLPPNLFSAMGTEIKNTKIILLSAVIFSAFFLAFLIIAILEPEKKEKEEAAITVSVPQKSQQTSSGQIAGILEGPTVVNITKLDNSSNETK